MKTKSYLCIKIILIGIFIFLGVFQSSLWAYQLSGKVTDSDGIPISDVELTVVLPSTGTTVGTGTSNTTGAYAISIDQGTYNIIVTPPQTSNYKSTTVEGITITGNTIQNVILVPKGITLSGRVLDRNNNGVKDVFVKVVNPCESIWVSLESTVGWDRTDYSGDYSIVVPAGTYDIIVRAYSGSYIYNKLNPQYAYYRVTEDLKIETDLTHNINLPIVYLTGTVIDSSGVPVSGVTIGNDCTYSYKYRSGKYSYNYAVYNGYATSGADGRYNFPVFKATYNIIVTPPSSSLCTKQFINGLNVTEDTTKDITLVNAPVLSGRVLDRNNNGVKDVFVKVVNPCESIWVSLDSTIGWSRSDCNGNYSVVVPVGTYDIIVRAYSGSYIYNKLNPQYAYYRVTEDLKIEESLVHNINLPIVYLTGIVVDSSGVPVSGVTIGNDCTYSYKYRSGKYSYNYAVYNGYATSGADGRYNFPVFKATYNIIVTPPSGSLYTKQFINGLCMSTDTTKDITLVNAPVLSGRVLDRNNNGVKDVFVKVVNPCESIWVSLDSTIGWSRSDCNGNYSVVVPAGTYDIIVRAYSGSYIYNKLNPQYAYYRVTEDLEIEESLVHNISLPIVYLTGIVVDSSGVPVSGVTIGNDCTYSYKYRSGKYSYNYAVYNGYATSGADGRYNFPVFKATYDIIVTPPSTSGYAKFRIEDLVMNQDISKIIILEKETQPPIQPPKISITSPSNGTIFNTPQINVCGTIDCNDSIVTINGAGAVVSNGTFSAIVTISEGNNTVTAVATNSAGSASESINVILDTTPPVIKIKTPADGSMTNSSAITVSGTFCDNIGVSQVTVNEKIATVNNNLFNVNGIMLNEGSNTILAKAKDFAGNTSSTSIIVIKDTTPPVIKILSPANGSITQDPTIEVTGNVDDLEAAVKINGISVSLNNGEFNKSMVLSLGENKINATATDILGNQGCDSITVIYAPGPIIEVSPLILPVVELELDGEATKTLTITNTGIGELEFDITLSDGNSTSTPWLSVEPINGVLLSKESTTVTLTYNGSVDPGEYKEYLYINSNDYTNNSPIVIEVRLIVLTDRGLKWYLAEGCTNGFDTWILIMNRDNFPAQCRITFMKSDGNTVVHEATVPATSRFTVHVNKYVPDESISTMVESTNGAKIIVERSMYWNAGGIPWSGGHCSMGVTRPSTTWYLAEGCTSGHFNTWVLIMNPNNKDAECKVTFMKSNGETVESNIKVLATSRYSINVGDFVKDSGVSTKVESLNGVKTIAERAIYWNAGGVHWVAGHCSVGVTGPGTNWFLAEGCTLDSFDEWILIMNPNAVSAEVMVTYMKQDGSTIKQYITVPPTTRYTIYVNDIVPNESVSAKIESTNGLGIIVERAMYWDADGVPWAGGHCSMGVDRLARTWYLAEGCTSGHFDTWVLIMNPNDKDATCTVTFMCSDGSTLIHNIIVSATSRYTIYVNKYVPNDSVSTKVESTNGVEIMVERSMYWKVGGKYRDGHCNSGWAE